MKSRVGVFTAAIVILLAGFVTSSQVKGFKPITEVMLEPVEETPSSPTPKKSRRSR